jgi:hypothetical protein
MNLRQILRNVRIRARDPRAQNPSDRTLLVLLSGHVQDLLTEANLRGGYWAVDEVEVTVGPGTQDYIVPVEGFGKAIEVRAVYPANSGHHSHDVDFYSLSDMNYREWSWPSFLPSDLHSDSGPYGDHRVAFYHKQGNVYMRVAQGGPSAGTTYRIIYQVGTFGDTTPLDEEVMMPAHTAVIEIRTAISALPHCEWFDEEDLNERRRHELALTLDRDEQRAYALFKSSAATLTAADQPTQRISDSID